MYNKWCRTITFYYGKWRLTLFFNSLLLFKFAGMFILPSPLWSGKSFRFSWDIPNVWWVWIYFHNGERKPWYRRTERPYRFRRWYFRGRKGTFRNIVHPDFPEITLYIFPKYSILPKKKVISLRVHCLDISHFPVELFQPKARPKKLELVAALPNIRVDLPYARFRKPFLLSPCISEPILRIPDEPDFTLPL